MRLRHAATMAVLFLFLTSTSVIAGDAEFLQSLQRAIEKHGLEWQAEMNPVAAMDPAEFALIAGGLELDDFELAGVPMWEPPVLKDDLPSHLDWRANPGNFTTGVRSQGYCGSCGAFAGVGMLESLVEIYNDDPNMSPNLSEAHLFFCAGGHCDRGTTSDTMMRYMRENGVPDDACFRYNAGETGHDQSCSQTCSDWTERALAIADYKHVGNDPGVIMQALNEGPLFAGMMTYTDLQYYDGGIYEHIEGDQTGAHAVVMVGYDEAQQYWICKNSWSALWGENGFFRIRWYECGIESYLFSAVYAGGVPCSQNTEPVLGPVQYFLGDVELEDNPTIGRDEELTVKIYWTDDDCNLAGGEIDIKEDDDYERYQRLPADAGCNSDESDPIIYEPDDMSLGEHVVRFKAEDLCEDRSDNIKVRYTVTEEPPDRDGDDDDDDNNEDDDDENGGLCS